MKCQSCVAGKYLKQDACFDNPSNCKTAADVTGVCTVCKDGYGLVTDLSTANDTVSCIPLPGFVRGDCANYEFTSGLDSNLGSLECKVCNEYASVTRDVQSVCISDDYKKYTDKTTTINNSNGIKFTFDATPVECK